VADFAFHPQQPQIYYVAFASGGLWKTENDGISWKALFEDQGSYALGVVEIDPHNDSTIWVGSGENNNQRSVGYGDGVYKSLDGGKSWENMGLKKSGHISMIRFHPTEPNTVFVAAQGPLWNSGGDRGLYKTTDGGDNWERILDIDVDTGINEFVIDSDNPDVIVASSYQRRRHVWTLINGGPGGGIHKTTDGGKTWRKISRGLPSGDLGRIGLAQAPSQPNTLYAIIEADEKGRGFYRSQNFGESWVKRSNRLTSSPQYYNELIVDPHNPERIYSPDTFTSVTEDGGKTWSRLSFKNKHVDDHAVRIDPKNTDHLHIGGDGGVYESWDRGQTWRHVRNLPLAQFYRATPDNDFPFYNVCAGTQDNHTLCGPSQNRFTDGITNADWWIAQFGDGFKPQFDPQDPNIVYAQYQNGGLVRFDKISGERISITPRPASGENNYKWNWSSPLIVSPHDSHRLYYGAEKLFRSDDRGDSWQAVSPDLTRQLDRNQLEVMGRIWSVDAISKNASTSIYGSLIAIAESPKQENLLYAGTDDGLIHVSTDGGENWRKQQSFRGVPDMSLVEDIIASEHDANVAYAVFDNHKRGDFKPYVLKTTDQGKSWQMMVEGLPERGSAHTLAQDHIDPDLLFVGTEFGVYFSNNGGNNWHELTDLPTVAVRDLEIQRRQNDLVIGTFGLGIYILDNYAPLRSKDLSAEATLFEIRDSWLFIADSRRGWGGKGDYGSGRYSAENPEHGVNINYYLKEGLDTRKAKRRKAEKERSKSGEDNPYPSWDELRAEDQEESPSVIITIQDEQGNVIRRLSGPSSKGLHKISWDMRYPATTPIVLEPNPNRLPWNPEPKGPLVLPGSYQVSLAKRVEGEMIEFGVSQSFVLKPMFSGGLIAGNRKAVFEFQQQAAELLRKVSGSNRKISELDNRIKYLKAAIDQTPQAGEDQAREIRTIEGQMASIKRLMTGDRSIARRAHPVPMSIVQRTNDLIRAQFNTQMAITGTNRDSYQVAVQEYEEIKGRINALAGRLHNLETLMEQLGAAWTPGRN